MSCLGSQGVLSAVRLPLSADRGPVPPCAVILTPGPVVRFSIPRSGIIKLIACRAMPSPLNLLNLLNPLNPHARRACPMAIPPLLNLSAHNPSTQPAAPAAPHKEKAPYAGSLFIKGKYIYLSLVRQRPRSQLRRKRRRCSISGVDGSSCSISRMASFSFRPERKMRRYAFFR